MDLSNAKTEYALRLGDNALVLAQRLGEWCGHAHQLEEDLALTNVALDLIGQAKLLLGLAGQLEGKDRSEDDLAFLRDGSAFRNVLLVEQPNGNFGDTIVRQFFYDAFAYLFFDRLTQSSDEQFAAIAQKSIKEVTYHLRHSSQWLIRLGDGTEESHEKVQTAVDNLWRFTGELFEKDELDDALVQAQVIPDLEALKPLWVERVTSVLSEATLTKPDQTWMALGGKQGTHTEHLGYLLAEMQFLQRAYPGASW